MNNLCPSFIPDSAYVVSEVVSGSVDINWRNLKCEKLCNRASDPSVPTERFIGFDLCSINGELIQPRDRLLISADLVLITPPRTCIRLTTKSGLTWQYSLDVLAGVIDPDYIVDIKIFIQNNRKEAHQVKMGEHIAQGILEQALYS